MNKINADKQNSGSAHMNSQNDTTDSEIRTLISECGDARTEYQNPIAENGETKCEFGSANSTAFLSDPNTLSSISKEVQSNSIKNQDKSPHKKVSEFFLEEEVNDPAEDHPLPHSASDSGLESAGLILMPPASLPPLNFPQQSEPALNSPDSTQAPVQPESSMAASAPPSGSAAPCENPLSPGFYGVCLSHAEQCGLTAACLLHFMTRRLLRTRPRVNESEPRFRMSLKNIQETHFPWMSLGALSRNLSELERNGLIIRDRRNPRGYDRTVSYRVALSVYDDIKGNCVYFDVREAYHLRIPAALILNNMRVRYRAAAGQDNEMVWLVLRPKDLMTRLPLSATTIRTTLKKLVPDVLECRHNVTERCSEYRPAHTMMEGQAAVDLLSECRKYSLLPLSSRGVSDPIPQYNLATPKFNTSDLEILNHTAQALGDYNRKYFPSGESIYQDFATSLNLHFSGSADNFYDLLFDHRNPDALHAALIARVPRGDGNDARLWDLGWVIGVMLRFDGIYDDLRVALYAGVLNNDCVLATIEAWRLNLSRHGMKRRNSELNIFQQKNRPREIDMIRSNNLEPAEKVRVFYEVINFKLRYGVWTDGFWEPYSADETDLTSAKIAHFFRRNRDTSPELLLDLHHKCQKLPQPSEDGDRYDGEWHIRRGRDPGFLVYNLDKIANGLGINVFRYCGPISFAPNGRPYEFDDHD